MTQNSLMNVFYELVPSNRLIFVELFKYIFRTNQNSTTIIKITIENLTFVNIVTDIAPIIPKLICAASKNDFGSASSVVPMSLENRFIIRPLGFVSKNRIFVEIKPRNIESCRFCDAVAQNLKNVMDRTKEMVNINPIIAPHM